MLLEVDSIKLKESCCKSYERGRFQLTYDFDGREGDLEIDIRNVLHNESEEVRGVGEEIHFLVSCKY